MTTIGDLVEEVVAELNQFTTNQERTGTFVSWVPDDGSTPTSVSLSDISTELVNARVELATGEIIHVSSYSVNGDSLAVPAWFRGQMGTVANDDVPENSRVVVDPQWPRFQVARKIVQGIHAISEDLFAVGETEFSSQPIPANYEMPTDLVTVLAVTIQEIGPSARQRPLTQWSLDSKNADGKTYLRVAPLGIAGHTIRVTYRKAVTVPDPNDLSVDWSTTGLPESASDLPGLYAKANLVLSPEAARAQQQAVEQGERQRTLQGWSASSSSRRYQEIFTARLADERRKLRDRYPVRAHKELI